MAEQHPLEADVAAAWPPDAWRALHVVVAVSGGSDSVATLRVLAALKARSGGPGRLTVAHYDHRVRGQASRADAAWVEALADRLGLRCVAAASPETGERSEERLRDERRRFLAAAAADLGARYIATGHTADDQVETILFRLFRGSGLDGLRGVAAATPLNPATTLVRPVLRVSRVELRRYLDDLGQPYREDATNASTEPTRNWLRQQLLPQVEVRFGLGVRDAVTRAADQAGEAHDVIRSLAEATLERAQRGGGAVAAIDLEVAPLREAPPLVAREAIRLAWRRAGLGEGDMTARHWRSLGGLAGADSGAVVLPGAVEARTDGHRLQLTRPPSA